MSAFRPLSAVLGLLLLAACAVTSQQVAVEPRLTNEALDVGRQQPVYLTVSDRRPSPLLGYRKDETGDRARIETGNDVPGVIKAAVEVALEDKGFALARSSSGAVADLTVEIVEIAYEASGTYVAPSVTTRAVFKGIARRGGTIFEQTYRLEKQSREALPLTKGRNEKLLNETVSEALTMLADDYQLMKFLAGAPAPRL